MNQQLDRQGSRPNPPPGVLDRTDESPRRHRPTSLAQTAMGTGPVLLIEGPPGIGKTALLDELARLARDRGMDVLVARGGEFEREFGFGVVRQLLETRLSDSAGDDRAGLLAGAASLAEPVFATVSEPTPGGDVAFATLHGLYWLVVNLAERAPLVLAVDDVHWADEPSLRFLLHLARAARRPAGHARAHRSRGRGGKRRPDLSALLLEAKEPILRPRQLSDTAVGEPGAGEPGNRREGRPVPRPAPRRPAATRFCSPSFSASCAATPARSIGIDPASVRRLAPGSHRGSRAAAGRRLDSSAPSLARAVAVLGDQARLLTCCAARGP